MVCPLASSITDFENFFRDHYNADNLILAFVGAISKDEAIKLVNEKFSNMKTEIKKIEQGPVLQAQTSQLKKTRTMVELRTK